MRLLTAVALVIFCTILFLFGSKLSQIRLPQIGLSIINKQKLLRLNATTAAQTITAAEASQHVGERTTVCDRIASEHKVTSSRGTPTFINLGKPHSDRVFTLLFFGSDRASVGAIPSSGMLCATGVITSHRDGPEIVVKDAKSWYVPK